MPSWEMLAEARIQEWLRRPDKERQSPERASGMEALPPMELQMVEEVLKLYKQAAETEDAAQKSERLKRAAEQEVRIFVLLEQAERPLAARHFAELLNNARTCAERSTKT